MHFFKYTLNIILFPILVLMLFSCEKEQVKKGKLSKNLAFLEGKWQFDHLVVKASSYRGPNFGYQPYTFTKSELNYANYFITINSNSQIIFSKNNNDSARVYFKETFWGKEVIDSSIFKTVQIDLKNLKHTKIKLIYNKSKKKLKVSYKQVPYKSLDSDSYFTKSNLRYYKKL